MARSKAMRGLRILVGAMCLAGCASDRDPAEAWLGRYEGDLVSESVDCESGEPVEPVMVHVTMEVVRFRDGLAIDGECPIAFDLTGDRVGRISPSDCEGMLDDGTPLRIEQLNGRLELDGDELSLSADARYHVGGTCDSAHDSFVGTRL